MQNDKPILGIDIGGTGLKMALIDVQNGQLLTEKYKELTPQPSHPDAVAKVLKGMLKERYADYKGPIGIGFPSIVQNGICFTAANIDKAWIDVDVDNFMTGKLGCPCYTGNDADLAGLAEVHFGHGKGVQGKVLVLTIGTGVGSGFFQDGKLIPNTELGHLLYKNDSYEKYVANSARKKEDLKWDEWGKRLNGFLQHVELLFSPDLIILGGGVSKKFNKYEEFFDLRTKVIPALFQNDAGVMGAAMFANVQHA